MSKSVSTIDALERHARISRRIHLFLIIGIVFVFVLFWWYVRPMAELAQTAQGDEIALDAASLSSAKDIKYSDISPAAWVKFKQSLGERQLVVRTTNVTNQTREVDETREVRETRIVQPSEGTYIQPDTSVENGQFTGSFADGFTLKDGSVVLGETTTGDYVEQLLATDGLTATLNDHTVTMELVAGDGIDVLPSGIAVKAVTGGGLAVTSSGVSLMSGCTDDEVLKWSDGSSSWECAVDAVGAGGVSARETDGSPSIVDVSRLDFGPASGSSSEFIVTDQGGGVVRVRLGSDVPLLSASATVTGGWTFSSPLVANGGVTCTDCIALGSETAGGYLASISAGTGLAVVGGTGEGATPTVSLDSSLALFKNIATTSGTNPIADGLTDTLTMTAGSGVAVTGDATTDTVTLSVIAASGGGMVVSGGIALQSCSDGQVLSSSSGSWSCTAQVASNVTCTDCVTLGSETAGNYLASITASDGLLVTGGSGEGATPTISLELAADGALDKTGGELRLQDCASGEILKFSTQWNCASDAATDVTCTDCVSLGAETLGNYLANIIAGSGLSLTGGGSEGATPTINVVTATGGGLAFGGGQLQLQSCSNGEILKYNSGWECAAIMATDLTCTDCIALGTETTGAYVGGVSAGSGIAITGSGGENSAPSISLDSSLAMFKTITTSGGTSPVADSLTDTLTFSSGNGVNVTGNATTDAVAFDLNLAVSGGLEINGSALQLKTCSTNQILKYSSGWVCAADDPGDSLAVSETDGSPSVASVTQLTFGPTSASSDEFIITNEGSGIARVRVGSKVALISSNQTITGSWTFSSNITANGGFTCADCIALGSETSGNYLADVLAGTGLTVTGGGSEGATPTLGLDSSLAMFKTITTSAGTSPVADSLTDTLTLASGNGVNVTGNATTDTATFTVALLSGGGLSVSASGLSLQSCSEGQILKYLSGSWACATDSNSLLATAYAQQLAGTDNVSVGASATPLLTNGSGTAQSLGIAITSGNEVAVTATVQFSSTVAAGAINYSIIRDDNHDNDCATGGGDGTQVGGTVSDYIVSVGQSFTTSFNFVDTSPSAGTNYYQVCGSTGIALGVRAATNRMLTLEEVNY